jgi:DNA-binding PadR family transcriptional regulator
MAWNRNTEKVISAALAVERARGRRPWTALDLISFLDAQEGATKPSDATVYRLLRYLDEQLGLLASATDTSDESRPPGRPSRMYQLTPAGRKAADSAASWLSHGGVSWAGAVVAEDGTT